MNDSYKFEIACKNAIIDYVNEHIDKTDSVSIGIEDVYTVWLCKTLQNSKALLSTKLPDLRYYECTYNGDKDELYLDVYVKLENKKIDGKDLKLEVQK